MRDLLLPCTKNVHFSYSGDTSKQTDGVAMGLSLRPLLACVFIVELERIKLATLREHISPWKRYVDDTISRIKEVENVLSKLKGNIKLTYEIENDGTLSFLDVMVIRKDHEVETETTVYRKSTNNDMDFH